MTSFLPVLLLVPGSIVLMCLAAIVGVAAYGVGHVVVDILRTVIRFVVRTAPARPVRQSTSTSSAASSRFAA